MTNNTRKETGWRSRPWSSFLLLLPSLSIFPALCLSYPPFPFQLFTPGIRHTPAGSLQISCRPTPPLVRPVCSFPYSPTFLCFPPSSSAVPRIKAARDKQRELVAYLSLNQASYLCIFQSALNGTQIKPQFYICFTSATVSAALFRFIAAAPD